VAHLHLGGLPASAAGTARKGVFQGAAVAHALGSPSLLSEVRSAFVDGMDAALAVSVIFAVVGALLALAFLPGKPRRTGGVDQQGKREPASA
jgi:MFS transporter, DHA2 family, multidrug resistance protein